MVDRLLKKHKAAAKFVPAPMIERRPNARVGIITIGGCDPAVREAVDLLAARGIPADYMRIRGFPFDESVEDFIKHHNFCFVVEQNRDAQLRSLLVLETSVPKDRLRSILNYGGFPLSARHVVEPIMSQVPPELHSVTTTKRFEFADHCVRYLGVIHHAVDCQTYRRSPQPASQCDRPEPARLRRRDVHAVRRLRP